MIKIKYIYIFVLDYLYIVHVVRLLLILRINRIFVLVTLQDDLK